VTDLLQNDVGLRSAGRARYGLLAVANPLPQGWENGGIAFRSVGCEAPEIIAICDVVDSTEIRPGDNAVFEPIFIRQTAACAAMSKIGSVDMAGNRLSSTTEWALGRALVTGAGSSNPALADATLVHDATDDNPTIAAISAVSCIEQTAADLGFGAEITLHAPFRAASYLTAANLLVDGLSPTGNPWIISPGYPGSDDGSAADSVIRIWATGPVWAGVTGMFPASSTGPLGWRQNYDAAIAYRLGMAAFDPCLNLSATFTVPACIGGS